jgi:tRNA threonylcarbamoyladenosine biosynthesis protein TsaE
LFQTITHTPQATRSIAAQLAELLEPGDVLTLSGDLGAGKTTFTQGLAEGLGVADRVNSPTFTLIREYEGRIPLYHMDVYRLGEQAAAEDLGIDEYLYGDGVSVIEWAEYIESLLPEDHLQIKIRSLAESEREITISGQGDRSARIVEELNRRCRI